MDNETLELLLPCMELKDSYRALVDEFTAAGEDPVPYILSYPNDDFPVFLSQLRDMRQGKNLKEGRVPDTVYWLVRNDSEVVGVVSLRHELTDALRRIGGHIGYGVLPSARRRGYATIMLRETLLEARELGIKEALVTCDKDNTGSVGTILNNGGVLDSEELLEEHGHVVQRYWIRVGD